MKANEEDINTTENERIMSAFDIHNPRQQCIGKVRAGTIEDIIKTTKHVSDLESITLQAITHIDSTIKAPHHKIENN